MIFLSSGNSVFKHCVRWSFLTAEVSTTVVFTEQPWLLKWIAGKFKEEWQQKDRVNNTRPVYFGQKNAQCPQLVKLLVTLKCI